MSYCNTQYHKTVHLITDNATALVSTHSSLNKEHSPQPISNHIRIDFSSYPIYSKTIYLDLNTLQSQQTLLHKSIRKSIMSKISSISFHSQHLSVCYDNDFCANFVVDTSERFYFYLIIAMFAMSLIVIVPWYFFYTQKLINPFIKMKKIADDLAIDQQLITYKSAFNFKNMAELISIVSEKLDKINDEKLRIFAAISHDLKTPITKATLYSKSHLNPKDQQALQKYFSDMDYLINQIQVFAKKSYFEEDFNQVNLSDLVESMYHEYHDAGFNVQFISSDIKPCIIKLQRKAFKRVLQNLIDNALKYAGDAQIKLINDALNNTISLEIIDSGSGIAEDKLSQIFEPFYRVDLARNHRIPGSGLGLAIAKEIIIKNKGHISIKNRTDSHGLIVSIYWKL
ncbi:sensor histidine kinase [Cysteiniphilum sp. JM-1]|uniref:sensor histidine kinase n=1 Tax=Cysteiniphilum sp. JM-1 TaxID=2610891 RepID=UPI00168D793D|nr:HAMP domain-containing sensor histidine kinase [Cysteiniphilum sp. JM-1]